MTEAGITKDNELILQKITIAADSLEKEKPFLKDVIRFYEKIFSLQHASDPDITKDYSALTDTKDFPCIEKKEFDIDFTNSQILLKEICDFCAGTKTDTDAAAKTNATAKIINDFILDNDFPIKSMVQNYLEGDLSLLKPIQDNKEFNLDVFDFIFYNSLKPSIVKSSRIIASYLKEEDQTEHGNCPVCGSAPALSLFSKENGSRSLVCSFCWHEWETKRISCPFCNNNESKTLGYVAIDSEKGIRADYCDKCKKYIKTIDLREYRKDFYYPLELIASIPFDMKMNEEGFKAV